MRRVLELIIIFLIVIIFVYAITGCSQVSKKKSWVSIEKAPMRVIYVDDEMDTVFINGLVDYVGKQEYKDYYFNESTVVSANANRSDVESDTDVHSRSVVVDRGYHEQEEI